MDNLSFSPSDPDVKGFQEVILSVVDLERSIEFYQRVFGWEVIYKGDGSSELKQLWQLADTCRIQEAVLINPGAKEGFLRIVCFANVDQEQVRSAAQTWDTGGIFDVNIRTKDMRTFYRSIQKEGWHGYADPLRYTFGEYEVTEVLLKTPEGATMAAMERHKPALVGFEFENVSRIFNSSIVTSNIEESHNFYIDKLGFELFFKTPGDERPHGPNVLGIPPNINGDITVPVHIFRPDINNFGSVEILELKELKGKDCSELAQPPNLGLLMLRFPVRDVQVYADKLNSKGLELNTPLQTLDIEPYGSLRVFSIRSPEGVWLEFMQLL